MTIQSCREVLSDNLKCPVTEEFLTQAVTVVPCGDKINALAAQNLFGGFDDTGWQVQSQQPCPVCQLSVIGYMADQSTGNMAKCFQKAVQILDAAISTLPSSSIQIEKDVIEPISYPGKGARFIFNGGSWNLYSSGGNLNRCMEFKSSTKDSFIKEFNLLGYNDGDVRISVVFNKNIKSELVDYFRQFDLLLDEYDFMYITKNEIQLVAMFKILAENNEIPESHFERIREIIVEAASH